MLYVLLMIILLYIYVLCSINDHFIIYLCSMFYFINGRVLDSTIANGGFMKV